MIEKLKTLLLTIKELKPEKFSGIGVILYNNVENLPISPLREGEYLKKMPVTDFDLVIKYLLEVSCQDNVWHDGFHLLSPEFHLTHFCQYVSTPIIKDATIEFKYGSRHRTALYGSFLENVVACGVISSDLNAVIFQQGKRFIL